MNKISLLLTLIVSFGINAQISTFQTNNSGGYSSAIGGFTTASGDYSVAMGANTEAKAIYSTAMGYETNAINACSTACLLYTSDAADDP